MYTTYSECHVPGINTCTLLPYVKIIKTKLNLVVGYIQIFLSLTKGSCQSIILCNLSLLWRWKKLWVDYPQLFSIHVHCIYTEAQTMCLFMLWGSKRKSQTFFSETKMSISNWFYLSQRSLKWTNNLLQCFCVLHDRSVFHQCLHVY